jgi:hypothetical protein
MKKNKRATRATHRAGRCPDQEEHPAGIEQRVTKDLVGETELPLINLRVPGKMT